MDWAIPDGTGLWQAALAVIPLVIVCNVLCRLLPLRAATRHTLWVATLLALILPLVLPKAPPVSLPDWTTASATGPVSQSTPSLAPPPVVSNAVSPIELGRDAEASIPPIVPAREIAQDAVVCPPANSLSKNDFAVRTPEPVHTAPLPPEKRNAEKRSNALATKPRTATPIRNSALVPRSSPAPKTEAPAVATPVCPTSAAPAPIANAIHTDDDGSWLLAFRATVATWFVAWIGALRWARDGLAQIPAVPPPVWIGGLALLVGVQALRIAAFCRRLKRGIPAPASILKAVDEVAAALGMKRTPRTLILNEHISPLIWCGRKPTLILPFGLWTQLDRHGKRAILAHELAHLQRLDHWVCWFEQAVTLLYWWHPLVWWIRKRIHEEADLSCDAWVTWLMPQGRRAYAEALLRTKQFVSANGADVPAGGMAAASGRAREFARRLTMVMTHSARPRRSMTGIVLATTVAAAGWIAAPAWSCPPGGEQAQKTYSQVQNTATKLVTADGTVQVFSADGQPATVETKDGVTVITTAKPGKTAKTDKVGVKFFPAVTTPSAVNGQPPVAVSVPAGTPAPTFDYWTTIPDISGTWTTTPMLFGSGNGYVLAQSAPPGRTDDERLAKLEVELKRISDQLAEMRHGQHGASSGGGHMSAPTAPVPMAPAQPAQPLPPTPPRATMRAPIAIAQGGPEVVRSYEMPQGKADALYNLMVRDDVPVRVSRDGNKISVHGSEAQQEVFAAFVEMIGSGNARGRAGGMGGGMGGMAPANRAPSGARRLAPPAAPHGGGSGGQQHRAMTGAAAEKALAEALAQAGNADAEVVAKKMLEKAELWKAAAQGGSEEARRKVEQVAEKLRTLGVARQADIEKYAKMAENMGQQAEQHSAQAQELLEQVAKITAEKVDASMRDKAKSLEKAAKDLEAKARDLEKKAAEWEKKAAEAESQADRVNEQADELNEMIESFDENSNDDADNDNDADSEDEAPKAGPVGVTMAAPAAAPACDPVKAADCQPKAAEFATSAEPKPVAAAAKAGAAPAVAIPRMDPK